MLLGRGLMAFFCKQKKPQTPSLLVLQQDERKLPLHDLEIVKATAPHIFTILSTINLKKA